MEQQAYALPQSRTQAAELVGRFLAKVYTWMALGLALTGGVAAYVAATPSILQAIIGNSTIFFLLIIATLGLVIGISAAINRISAAAATGMFIAYSALNGVLFSTVFLVYTGQSIAQVFFITAGTFGAMSVYGMTTKRDLTRIGQLALMALIGLIIASVVNIFFRSSGLSYLISYAGVAIFVGLTAYDTQRLKRLALTVQEGTESFAKASIVGALALYLDFINLFLMLLRILGRRR